MTTVLWQSLWRPHSHPRHGVPPTPILRRGFSVSTHRHALPLIHAVNFKKQLNMAANYKVLQWNERPDWKMTKEFMENYKIDMLRIFPGVVEEKLTATKTSKKGAAKAERAHKLVTLAGKAADRTAQQPSKKVAQEETDINEDMPEFVPYPDQIVTLKNTNLYEALKYVRPGHFLIPSETIPTSITGLPNGRIPSFDIIPVKQTKLTVVNIARFHFLPSNPKEYFIHSMGTMWTHFLKSIQVTGQLSFRPRAVTKGFSFEWMWENCVHLRPEVMQRALPSTTCIALGPLTNGNEATWLVVPRGNPADYRARWSARQLEQTKLLKAGRGMLPLEERRRLKKELKIQMKSGRGKKDSILMVSPMAMSVARLGIQRRIDDLLFKYEKLYGNVRSYIGTRYGTGRFMDRGERLVVNKLVRMEKVDLLKYTPEPFIPNRKYKYAQLEAATGQSQTSKYGSRSAKREHDLVEPRSYDDQGPDLRTTRDLQTSDSAQLKAVEDLGGWKLRPKPRAGRPLTEDDLKRERREQAFIERIASAKLEEEKEEILKREDNRDIWESSEVAAEDKIETLKKEAQEPWEEDDALNYLLSPKANGVMDRPQDEGDLPASANFSASEHERNRPPSILQYQRRARDDGASELPREPQNDRYRGPESDSQSDSSSNERHRTNTSESQTPKIEPFQPIEGIGSDIILMDQYKLNSRPPSSRVKPQGRQKSKGAPIKKRRLKKVVDEFAHNPRGEVRGINNDKRLLSSAFKMDFAVARDK